ncbi:MAG: hypothetical protein M0P31_13830 [Solirubrobacteraceae bacterium]|nr:hypothetical protein [Solirubrobacteraceae bacterium]
MTAPSVRVAREREALRDLSYRHMRGEPIAHSAIARQAARVTHAKRMHHLSTKSDGRPVQRAAA